MSWHAWLLFAVTETFLCLSPGPAVLFVISNCPQVNNPCNGFNPTPIRVVIWDAQKN